jgi:serine/threonine protein kinase/tetratricopeptide (TPR) repeat protein
MQAQPVLPVISDRYQLQSELGHGGMGAVFRATDRLTGQAVALKQLLHSKPASTREALSHRLDLSHEFQTLASLRHPNIISVLDYGFDEQGQPYFTMPLLEDARSLRSLNQDQPLDVKVGWIIQILQALVYLHRRGIIHRDLKPENILVSPDGQLRVLDFGLAVARERADLVEDLAGTLQYIAPEVLEGESPGRESDLYAVGVMLYEFITGHHPFRASTVKEMVAHVISSEPDMEALDTVVRDFVTSGETVINRLSFYALESSSDPMSEMMSGTPLTRVVQTLLVKSPAYRYDDAQRVIHDLNWALGLPPPDDSPAIRDSFLQAAKFVGRDDEFGRLTQAVDALGAGTGGLWLIGGESGVGKSRLLDELRTVAMVHGVLVLRGQSISEGELPYQLWREPLRRLLLAVEVSDEEAGVLRQIVPDIERLLERDILDPAPLSGRDAEQRLKTTIAEVFRRAFDQENRRLLVILEDLQWTSKSLDVIPMLMGANAPLMILGSYRDDEAPDLPHQIPGAEVVRLQRLNAHAIRELSEAMLGEAGRKPQVVNLLEHETEGNVFFLVEVLRALAEEAGNLSRIGAMTLPANVFAGGVQRIVERRLHQVPARYRGMLGLAAVGGRQLNLDVLRYASGVDDLDEWLTAWVNAAVIDLADGSWRFAHDKLRESLLGAMEPETRRELHRHVAQALEAIYADDLDQYAAALMVHWNGAGDQRREGHYALIAAQQADDNSAYADAARWFTRALEIRAYEAAENPDARHAELHYQLGVSLYKMNRYDEARGQQRASLDLYRRLEEGKGIADAINALGESDMRQGLLDDAQAQYEEALAIRQELGLTKDIAYSYMNLGVVQYTKDNHEVARDLFGRCLEYMEQVGAPRDLARALNNYANITDELGEKDKARELHLRALAIREEVHDLHGICYSLGNLGILEYEAKNYRQAQDLLERALLLAQQIGDRLAVASNLTGLGDIHLEQKQYAQAITYYQQGLDLRRETGDRHGMIASIRALGHVARERADYDWAFVQYREAFLLSVDYGLDLGMRQALSDMAQLLIAQKNYRPALKLLAFLRKQTGRASMREQEMINDLHTKMLPTAFAGAETLGEALTLDGIRAKIEDGSTDF